MAHDGSFDPEEESRGGQSGSSLSLLDSNLMLRLRALSQLLQQQVRDLDLAYSAIQPQDGVLASRLRAVRETSRRLEKGLDVRTSATASVAPEITARPPQPPITPSPTVDRTDGGAAPSAPAVGGHPSRMRQTVQVELRPAHLLAMRETGALDVADIEDRIKVQKVLQAILDRWSGLHASTARKGVQSRPAATVERRRGHDRRHSGPRPDTLVSYVEGSAFDRRVGTDRRSAERAGSGAAASTGLGENAADAATGRTADKRSIEAVRRPAPAIASPQPPAKNVVRFTEVREVRIRTGGGRPSPRRAAPIAGDVVTLRPAGAVAPTSPSASAQHVEGVDGERHPDAREDGHARPRERLGEDEQREQQMARRCDVLQQADGGEPDTPGAGDEQDQR